MGSEYLLDQQIAQIRRYAGEPSQNPKFDDDTILSMVEECYIEALTEINPSSDAPVIVRHSITFGSGTQLYMLPPSVGQILDISKLDSLGYPEQKVFSNPLSSWSGPGYTVEGRLLRLSPTWQSEETMTLSYIPNGDFRLHRGAITPTGAANTVILQASPIKGTLDTRENAYVGSILRFVDTAPGVYVDERVVTAYDRTTRTATFEPALDSIPAVALPYEILPSWFRLTTKLIELSVAIPLSVMNGNRERIEDLTFQRNQVRRNVRNALGMVNRILALNYTRRSALGDLERRF